MARWSAHRTGRGRRPGPGQQRHVRDAARPPGEQQRRRGDAGPGERRLGYIPLSGERAETDGGRKTGRCAAGDRYGGERRGRGKELDSPGRGWLDPVRRQNGG